MGRLTVRLPDALHRQLETLARSEGVSLNQYLVYALTRQATLDFHSLDAKGNGRQRSGKTVVRRGQAASDSEQTDANLAGEQGEAGDLRHLADDDFSTPSGK